MISIDSAPAAVGVFGAHQSRARRAGASNTDPTLTSSPNKEANVAVATVTPAVSPAQLAAANNLDTREITQKSFALVYGCSLHMAIIQQPIRKWERPWLHQRAIVLFATSPEETKLRLQFEGRLRRGERVLQIIQVGE